MVSIVESSPLKGHALIIACWIAVIGCGAFLRFNDLSKRPFHADEATGARITAHRMESGDYHFDPSHYHGPALSSLAMPLLAARGETGWRSMTKATPRLLTAIAGTLLLLVPLLWRKPCGDGPMVLAAALLATSPLLVYYSRMFIHESLLVLFGMLALAAITRFPRYGIPGIFVGLMFATKETFAISIIAWSGAAALVAAGNRGNWQWEIWRSRIREYGMSIGLSLFTAALVAGYFYTDGFHQPRGAVDAVRTFFVYQTVGGHDKPFSYYLSLLFIPGKSGGLWWFGTPVALLAAVAFYNSWKPGTRNHLLIRFLAFAAAGHFLIYSMIGYKTPWLACLPWAHVCLLAGFCVVGICQSSFMIRTVACLLIFGTISNQFIQSRRATGRMASDARNPFAYVPTRGDVETLGSWLDKLQEIAPGHTLEPIAVVGTDYWPLPWYLRSYEKIGYWPATPPDLTAMPLVFAMPDGEEIVMAQLGHTHTYLPRGLRAGVPMGLFVRNDIWDRWMKDGR